MVRLSFLVQSIYAEVVARYDLTPAQTQLMCVLKDQSRGMGELTDVLRLEKSSVTGLVERAERRGLLERAMSPADRRAVTVSLTERGKSVTDRFYDEVSRRLEELTAGLPVRDRDGFTEAASRIVFDASVPPVFGAASLRATGRTISQAIIRIREDRGVVQRRRDRLPALAAACPAGHGVSRWPARRRAGRL
jgi:DNA-binding MarR family transcriptional regulator